VDAVGMYSWTPLLVATRANKPEIVDQILAKSPNINTIDKDGMTALAIACKEGSTEIALKLLNSGAYTNLQVLNLYINVTFGLCTVCPFSISSQTSWPKV
jgi:ankyrin repeat-rich membrane spanning protein